MIVGVVLLVLAAAGWFWFVRDRGSARPPAPVLETVIEEPISGAVIATTWSSPSAVAVAGDHIYVLDSGNNRILSMNRQGVVDSIICETGECAFLLDAPQDMEIHDGLFYVANTERGQVDVIDDAGSIIRTYLLPVGEAGSPRATGVHVADDGSVYVSDWVSGKIAIFAPDGTFLQYFGADTVGEFEFVEPTGLTLDDAGNLYIAEYSLGRVEKISPEGRQLANFWMIPGSTKVSQATDVVLTDTGLLYMTDNKRSVVQVFSEAASYLGIVGLLDATRRDSPIALLRPQGIAAEGNEIFVIDRRRGLLIFDVDPRYFLSEPTA